MQHLFSQPNYFDDERIDLTDLVRKKNINKKSFTYESVAQKLKSRIEFFWLPNLSPVKSLKWIQKTSIALDHKAVKLRLGLINSKHSPGLWKFNNLLLKDKTYVSLITDSYPDIIQKYSNIKDPKLKWELIKMEIWGITIPYTKNRAREVWEIENELEKRLETLDGKIYSGEETSESKEKEYEHLKIGLRHIYEKKAEGAIFRSKVRWIQEGKKLTKYFFNLERKNFNKKVISELRMADGHVTVNESQIMKEAGFSTVL